MRRFLVILAYAQIAGSESFTLPEKETLAYNVEWRLITAGKATLHWDGSAEGRPGREVKLHLASAGFVSKLFKVEDDYTARLSQTLCAESSDLMAREGSRRRETKVSFDPAARKATYQEWDLIKNTSQGPQQIEIPECVHDVIGGLYYLRTLNLEAGQSAEIPVSDGKKSVMAKVEAQQREAVKVPAGSFKTTRYEVFLFHNVLYRRPAHLHVWITDDTRRLPVQIRVRMQFTVGTITLQLESQESS